VDIIDGREVPPRRIVGEETIADEHQGSIIVESGAHLRLTGAHQGSLRVQSGAAAEILGQHQGSLHVWGRAHVQVHGRQQGSVHVAAGGLVEVAATGRCQGSLHVEGRFVNGGVRGGSVHGHGTIDDVEGGRVKQPDEIKPDGSHVYRWSD
jgi:hypothetical protein